MKPKNAMVNEKGTARSFEKTLSSLTPTFFRVSTKLLDDFLEEAKFMEDNIERVKVVVMPDFFLDRLVSLNYNVKEFSELLEGVTKRKGGSIDGVQQTELRGGNAINTASALAALGLKVTPIVCTNRPGSQLIKFHLKHLVADFSHLKIFDELSMTTAMELLAGKGKINVMLRNVGPLSDFGPQHLNDKDFEAIRNADYVCVFNWAGTKNFGTDLATTVFHCMKTGGKGKTYFDTADPIPNKEKIPQLMKNVLQDVQLDILSLNENEAICYASQLSNRVEELRKRLEIEDLAKESARILASHLSARIDLHTTRFSATFIKRDETIVPVFQVPVLRATGAGDAWNAGNILGDALGLSSESRLSLANAVAAYYVSNPSAAHPTRKQLMKFCEKLKRKADL
jgi:sugar/nucleoside kinase (ribokinase family)